MLQLMQLRSQHKTTHFFLCIIVYGYFEMPIFGRHTKLGHTKVISRFGGTLPHHDYLKTHFKSINSVFNIPEEMYLWPQILFSVIHLPFMMEALWHNSLWARILWYVMLVGSRFRNNLSIHSRTASRQEELWIPLSLMVGNMKFQRKLLTFSGAYS